MTLSHLSNSTDTTNPAKHVMIVAGEASGDLHGAVLARELLALDSSLILSGIGGAGMAATGVTILYDISRLAVMGIIEVISRLKDIRSAMKTLEKQFEMNRPDLLILIDYPGFNLELARRAKKYNIPVLYYISPKIWAWREGRITRIKKYVDRMAVILPFEKKYYKGHGFEVDFVGNPLLDQVQPTLTSNEFKIQYGIDHDATIIGIMPGSRKQEIAKILPVFMETALLLNEKIKKCVFLLPLASTLTEDDLNEHGVMDDRLDIRIIKENRYETMAACDAAMAASGTLTMELGILQVPMVVCYRISKLTHFLAKPFIKAEYASLVNLVAEKEVVTELLQQEATPENIYREILPLLLNQEARDSMKQELFNVSKQLGEPGASKRTARLAMEMLVG
ncbi:MAG: lipid-A-disaccharide synthase [Desulfobacterales bacterium]|nr:lipid-A-disaccharide synthase [Desulfobacterales bacterium]